MHKRGLIPLLTIVMLLAGCFRQANDSFDTVNSEGSEEQPIITQDAATPTTEIVIIDPDASPTTIVIDDSNSQAADEPTATVRVIQPTVQPTTAEISATEQPATEEPSFLTPQVEVQATIPAATPTVVLEQQSTLMPTPTAFGNTSSTCEYAVQPGDNLFRIAINNNVTLAALLSANGLSENSIIQPGQILNIPDCGIDTTPPETDNDVLPTQRPPTDCEYIIQPGDTLYDIALAEGVALADLLAENGLSENAIIQPGETLQLPGCQPQVDLPPADQGDTALDVEATQEISAPEGDTITHQVVAGETLLSIARRYNVTVNDIIQANDIPDLNNLTVGMMLTVPQTAEN